MSAQMHISSPVINTMQCKYSSYTKSESCNYYVHVHDRISLSHNKQSLDKMHSKQGQCGNTCCDLWRTTCQLSSLDELLLESDDITSMSSARDVTVGRSVSIPTCDVSTPAARGDVDMRAGVDSAVWGVFEPCAESMLDCHWNVGGACCCCATGCAPVQPARTTQC